MSLIRGFVLFFVCMISSAQALTLQEAHNWAYLLDDVSPSKIKSIQDSNLDMIVIQPFMKVHGKEVRISKETIAALKHKANGGTRIVISYLAAGEAENYREYWKKSWNKNKPSFIVRQNPKWDGAYLVKYWTKEWHNIVLRQLEPIKDAGFDGVALDSLDSHYEFGDKEINKQRMIDLVADIRNNFPKGIILAHNAEDLAAYSRYVHLVDGIVKEDLFFGIKTDYDAANTKDQVWWAKKYLTSAHKNGKVIFVIEYLKKPKNVAYARQEINKLDFRPYFTTRELNFGTEGIEYAQNQK